MALSYQYTIQPQPIRARRFHCPARAAEHKEREAAALHSLCCRLSSPNKLSENLPVRNNFIIFIMTLEEVLIQKSAERAQCTGQALEEVLVSAKDNQSLTVGVYECAKVMNLDPDSVSFCVLATDEQFECDIALQIHFTLIQSFCFDNDISIVRVSDVQRLAELVGDKAEQLEDAHCVLITNPAEGSWEDPALEKLHLFCEESRRLNDWVPEVSLPGR
ncbi:growth arrest and DNA damage-inducible protein GADD45 gamma-like [Hippoglossus hippoglossus]|uniref:growth arrest and DNA damage-inducible protein GADD45 gamma-like n=2 Tax=Hippoglossus TaxID=8266 RepID=UPI00148C6887|nr:growth arrest and DNA damage-inducible protein GADD45 gamma-like [Hippoglossus hippoglossus]